jgi:hypothetical protein
MQTVILLNGVFLLAISVLIGVAISSKKWRKLAIIGLVTTLFIIVLGGLLYAL